MKRLLLPMALLLLAACSGGENDAPMFQVDSGGSGPLTLEELQINLPETLEWMGAETKPPASAMSWPTLTLSRILTTGFAGAPMCWDRGMTTMSGTGAVSMGRASVEAFACGGCTPPAKA